jgi:N-acyl-D-aspartate/D-glutamate deacylase
VIEMDLLIKNGCIVDGSGNPWFKGEIGINSGKISKVGISVDGQADSVIDANQLVVCPGFIDIHSHGETGLENHPRADNLVRQGVTLFVGGQCGSSPAPTPGRSIISGRQTWNYPTFEDYFNKIESNGLGVNAAFLVGHGTLRNYVMGMENREPTEGELDEMKMITAEAMKDGVLGLSTGLAYPPGFYAKTEEIIELCKVVSKYGRIYATHIRGNTKKNFLQSMVEAFEIAKEAKCPVQISHLETHYDGWGMQGEATRLLDDARENGIVVSCDACTMVVGGANLFNILPKWAFEGGDESLKERLRNPSMRLKIIEDIKNSKDYVSRCIAADGRWDLMLITDSERYPEYIGRTMQDLINDKGKDQWDVVFDLLLEGPPKINQAHHNEDDMRKILCHPTCSVETDAGIIEFPEESLKVKFGVIPRGISTYPMVFRKYVRGETRDDLMNDAGEKLFSLEEAIRKMTSLPAQSLGLFDRGLIRQSNWADIVIFDKDRIRDLATYEYPYQYPIGIEYVLINGEVVIENGEHTGTFSGRIVKMVE